jgi:hypothetical protein
VYKVIRKRDRTGYNPTNEEDLSILSDKVKNEYKYVIELLYGLEYAVRELFSLVPCKLNNLQTNKAFNHRNNLFIATNVLGYMNIKLTDFNIKNNSYLNIKLSTLLELPNQTKNLKDKEKLEKLKLNIDIIKQFYSKNDIFKIEQLTSFNDYNIADHATRKIQNFTQPTSAATSASPTNQKRCIIWTYPLFNFNNGVLAPQSLQNQPSRDIIKNIIMNFIKNNYYNADTAVQITLTNNISNAISANFVADNEITKLANGIHNLYDSVVDNYKNQIIDGYKNLIKFMKDVNSESQTLLKGLMTEYLEYIT